MLIHVPFKIRLLNCIERFHKTISCAFLQLTENSRHRNALFNASIMKSTGGKTRGSPKNFEFTVKSVQLVLRGTYMHSRDILIKY